jgi:hypothetical protein
MGIADGVGASNLKCGGSPFIIDARAYSHLNDQLNGRYVSGLVYSLSVLAS